MMQKALHKLIAIGNSKSFQIAAFLLLIALILISLPYPGTFDFDRDYRWLAARAFGQSETIMQLLAQHGDLYDYKHDVSYDTLAFSQQPLNPFFIIAHFTNPFLGNYLAIMFISALSFFYCRRIVQQTNYFAIFPILAAAFFLSQSFDHHFASNLALNSLFAVPIYYVITCKILKSQKPSLLDWSIITLGPLIMDLHAPLVLGFTALFAMIVQWKNKGIDFKNWTYKNTAILIAILAIHAFGWLPWLQSSSDRPEITLEKLLNLKNIFVPGVNNLHELMMTNNGYRGIFKPVVGSGTFFYMPVAFIFTSFALITLNRAHIFARCLYAFSVAMVAFAFFINSKYVYDILQPLSYFRFPLNIIPPLLLVSSLTALYNTKPTKILLAAYLLAFLVDCLMPYRGLNDPYIFLHYGLAAIVVWLGCNRDKKTITTGVIPVVALIYTVIMIVTVIPNAYKFAGVEPEKSIYLKKSMEAMKCLQEATGNKPFTPIIFTGVSEYMSGKGRLYSEDTSYLVEDSRGFNLTSYFLYREFIDQGQADAQAELFFPDRYVSKSYPWTGRNFMPPEIGTLPTPQALHVADIQYLGMIGKDWQAQDWWKKNKSVFTYKATCQLVYDKMDVYALNPESTDYTLTHEASRQWHVDAKKGTTITVPIANRPTTRIYLNGVETPALDARGAIKVNVAKGESDITITNFNVKHILAYLYFWYAMISVAGLALLGLKRCLVARDQ